VLRVNDVSVSYDGVPALRRVSFSVEQGQKVCIIGSNGAGKSTILRTISGLLHPIEGSIEFEGEPIHQLEPHAVVAKGIAHVPEGRRIFRRMSVLENLLLGAYTRKSQGLREQILQQIFEIFPILKERQTQQAGTLSGGEQQMLAIARGFMSCPKLLMLDEPSLGIMPILTDQLFEVIDRMNQEGVSILLVEQNVCRALELADKACVLQSGSIMLEGTGQELLNTDFVRRAYLGL
jgi:branched-chain amino acid transport system ATP-binding protein